MRFIWHEIEHLIQDALDAGNALTRASTIFTALECKEMQLYTVMEDRDIVAVFVTEICDEDDERVCNTVALAGDGLEKWLDNVEHTICRFAKSKDCKYVRMKGRRGWLKKLDKYGWSESAVEMSKEL